MPQAAATTTSGRTSWSASASRFSSVRGPFTQAASDAKADDDAHALGHADADAAAGAGASRSRQRPRAHSSTEGAWNVLDVCLSWKTQT